MKTYQAKVTQQQDGERFDIAARELLTEVSRKKIKKAIDSGGAWLNKKRVQTARKAVKAGDLLEIFWDDSVQTPQLKPQHILYESPDFLAVFKPAGLNSQGTLTHEVKGTIIEALRQLSPRFQALHLVHRLDRETSGVMLLARTQKARAELEKLFKERKVKKVYDALCFGCPESKRGTVELPLRKDSAHKTRWMADHSLRRGGVLPRGVKSAKTDFVVCESFQEEEASWIRCYPMTGRTHQIRLHLQALDAPILGDKLYAAGVLGHSLAQSASRQMLHAFSLSFPNPFKNSEKITIEAPWPEDMEHLVKELRS